MPTGNINGSNQPRKFNLAGFPNPFMVRTLIYVDVMNISPNKIFGEQDRSFVKLPVCVNGL